MRRYEGLRSDGHEGNNGSESESERRKKKKKNIYNPVTRSCASRTNWKNEHNKT